MRKHIITIYSCFLMALPLVPAFSQATSTPEICLVFPAPFDTVDVKKIRFAGSTAAGSGIWVQEQPVEVYESGAFVGMVDLSEGWNVLQFRSQVDSVILPRQIEIFRQFDHSYPELPTTVRWNSIFPASDLFIVAGETLAIGFTGSPKGQAFAGLAGTDISMQLTSAKGTVQKRGRYSGQLKIPVSQTPGSYRVDFKFIGLDGQDFRFPSPGLITVLPADRPRIGVTHDSTNFLLSAAGGDLLMTLPPEVPLRVVNRDGPYYKVRLSSRRSAFIDSTSLAIQAADSIDSAPGLNGIDVLDGEEWLTLRFNLSRIAAYQIIQNVRPARLDIFLFHVKKSGVWRVGTDANSLVKQIRTNEEQDGSLRVRVSLAQKQQWGYRARYEQSNLFVEIRKPPGKTRKSALPLTGLRIAVDAGHGGENSGGISPTGIDEKGANLRLATKVSQLLRAAGASTSLTRAKDLTVELADRVAIARKNGAHLLISIHHNSIGLDVDPLRVRGTGVYYTVPQSRAPADAIFRQLLGVGLKPFGLKKAPFHLTRQTDFLTILVEAAFLTHPQDEILLLQEPFVDKMAQAIATGVERFFLAK